MRELYEDLSKFVRDKFVDKYSCDVRIETGVFHPCSQSCCEVEFNGNCEGNNPKCEGTPALFMIPNKFEEPIIVIYDDCYGDFKVVIC